MFHQIEHFIGILRQVVEARAFAHILDILPFPQAKGKDCPRRGSCMMFNENRSSIKFFRLTASQGQDRISPKSIIRLYVHGIRHSRKEIQLRNGCVNDRSGANFGTGQDERDPD